MRSDAILVNGALTAGAVVAVLLSALLRPEAGVCGLNPVGKGLPRSSAYGETLDNNVKSALCVDCHSRTPGAPDNTARGSHFVHLSSGSPTLRPQWETLIPWTGNGYSTTYSKYGATGAANQPPGVAGEMICESCHNVIYNVGKYKLLALDNEAADPNPLCGGCHTDETMPGHHPMTGDAIGTRGGLPLSTTLGTVLSAPLDNATYPAPNGMNCRSCHRAHGSPTVTGARVLKRGVGTGVQGVGTGGAERQSDVDPAGTNRLVTDFTPLCASCHTE